VAEDGCYVLGHESGAAEPGDLDLTELIDWPAMQSVMDDFFGITNIAMAIVDLRGRVLVSTGWQDICAKFHRLHPQARQNCQESDTVLSSGVDPGQFKLYRCRNHMWDMATPIMVEGRPLANLFLGQFFFEGEVVDLDLFRSQAKRYGFDEDQYLAALDRVPRWKPEAIKLAMAFYTKVAGVVANLSHGNIRLKAALAERDELLVSLGAREEHYRALFGSISDAVLVHEVTADGLPGRFIEVNQVACDRLGYSREEMLSLTPPDITHGVEFERLADIRMKLADQGRAMFETTHVASDGRHIPVESHVRIFRGDGLDKAISICRDITGRRRDQEALQESERRYRQLFEAMINAFALHEIILDADGRPVDYRFLEVNPAFEKLTGLKSEDVVGRTVLEVMPCTEQHWIETYGRVALSGESIRFEDYSRELDKYYEVAAYCPAPGRFATLFQDITDRKKAEQALRDRENLLRNIIDSSADYIYVKDVQLRTILCNKVFAAAFEKSPEELIGQTDLENGWDAELVKGNPEKSIRGFEQDDREALAGRTARAEYEPGNVRGEVRLFDTVKLPLRDDKGRVIGILGISRDVTERKAVEDALRESEEKFRRMVELIPDLIAIHQDGRILFVNPKGAELLGAKTPNEIIGRSINDFVRPDGIDLSPEGMAGLFHEGGQSPRYELKIRRLDGREMDFEVTGIVFRHDGRPAVQLLARDITERKVMENQLRQATKMEAVGTLAGGVAHDFNNLLQAINGYTQIMLLDKTAGDPDRENLTAIYRAGDRAAQLVRQLLLFSRKADSVRRVVDLNQEVEQSRLILERTLPRMIEIELHLAGRLWPIKADPVQIEQILLNLGGNAADSMPGGGRLIIETANMAINEDFSNSHLGATSGHYVLLTVADTGHGMDQETMEHVFEPFYTTKAVGKGTGLGLASVYGIVKSHGGYISCYSQVGSGTVFKIYLPAMAGTAALPTAEAAPSPVGGTEAILLVDDEAAIREFAAQALTRFGYTVRTAATGEEALEIYAGHGDSLDLVVLDIGMPGMGGLKCLQEILVIDPSAQVLVASGYSVDDQVKTALAAGAADYIGKPYHLKDFFDKVRSALDERPSGTKT
jgi:PAS domain S-box-containing protein